MESPHISALSREPMDSKPRVSNHQLNTIISAWLCIAIGSGLTLSGGSPFSIALSAPLSIGGVILLIVGINMGDNGAKSQISNEWEPSAMEMRDAGRPMFRIDTTLDEPIRTSILCGRCAEITWIDGRKPKSFTCPSCAIDLWNSEEE